jgi:hypothetical protein
LNVFKPLFLVAPSGSSGATIAGVKRSSEVLTLDSYVSDAEYEVDDNGVVVVMKSGGIQKKKSIDGKRLEDCY